MLSRLCCGTSRHACVWQGASYVTIRAPVDIKLSSAALPLSPTSEVQDEARFSAFCSTFQKRKKKHIFFILFYGSKRPLREAITIRRSSLPRKVGVLAITIRRSSLPREVGVWAITIRRSSLPCEVGVLTRSLFIRPSKLRRARKASEKGLLIQGSRSKPSMVSAADFKTKPTPPSILLLFAYLLGLLAMIKCFNCS